MANDKINITLKIGKATFPLSVTTDEEEIYRKAAKTINDTIGKYRNMYPEKETETYLSMTLLELAVSKELISSRKDLGPIKERIEALTKEIEPYITKK